MEEENGTSRNRDESNQNDDNTPLSQDTGGSGPARSQDHGDSPLHQCVRDKSLGALKDVVASYTDKDSLRRAMEDTNYDGMTPLIMAASMDWDEGVDVLLDTRVLDKYDITHLVHEEIINKEYEISYLHNSELGVERKELPDVVPDSPEANDWTVFTLTAAVGWVGGLKALIKAGVDVPLNKIKEYNVLHIAIFSCNEAIPILVLDALDDERKSEVVNNHNDYIYSPIYYAIERQCCRLVRRLLQYVDADHVKTYGGYNILHHAAEYAQPEKNGEQDLWTILLEENNSRHNLINEMFMECYDDSVCGTPLFHAARMKNLYSIRVLSKKCNKWLSTEVDYGETPLHYAAAIGSDEMIRCIVNEDVRTLMATDDNDHTPLAIALIGNTNVELLLNLGVPSHKFDCFLEESMHETITTDDMNKSYGTTLCVAAECGNLKCVQTLHEKYKVSLRHKDRDGMTPLHHAVEGREEIIRYIVEKDRKTLTDTDDNGYTPLAIAITSNSHSSTVELLLELGASYLKQDDLKKAFFINKCDEDKKWMSSNPLQIAIQYGNLDTVKILGDKYDHLLTTTDHKGWTLVHYAAAKSKGDVIEYIVRGLGLEDYLEATDNDGQTPLEIAIINNNDISIKPLLKQIAIIHRNSYELDRLFGETMTNRITDKLYGPIIRLAAEHGYVDCVKFLYKENNELLSNKDDKGWTPLHYAATHGRDEVIRYIVNENSKTLKAKDNMGNTPLITAIVHKNESSVKLLLELGASLAETISKEAEDSLLPAETPNSSDIPPTETPNVAYVPPEETPNGFPFPLAETRNGSDISSAETPHVAYVPPEETPNGFPIPLAETRNGSDIPSAETPHVAFVPPEETPNGFPIPLVERHTVCKIPPAETPKASLVENDCKSFFAQLFYEEKSALQLILYWWKNEKLAKDLLDSCIKGNVKDTSVGGENSSESHVQLNFEIFQSEDGRWFNFVHLLQGRQELLLHPVTESLVWQSTQDVKHQIYYNSAVHFVFLWFFYKLIQHWISNEEFTIFDAVSLPILFLWLIFVYIQDLHNQARWSPSSFLPLVLFCSIFAAIVLTTIHYFTSSELVITLSKLLFYPAFLRIVSYYDQAISTTFLHVVKAVAKLLVIAAVVIFLFVAVFMTKLDLHDPLNDFGKTMIKEVKGVYNYIVKEITFDTIGKVIAGLTAVGGFISKMNVDVDWIKKYFERKNKSDVGDAITRQATVLESLSRSYFFNNSKFTTSIKVRHDRKLDNKDHGSIIFGNRIWECVAEWYVNHSDPERQEDKKKFMEAKGLQASLCEVKSTQPSNNTTG